MSPAPARAPARAFDLVVFDLDGTLLDTAPDIAGSLAFALARRGLPAAPEALVRTWIGGGTATLLRRALAWAQADPGLLAATTDDYLDHHRRTCGARSQIFPGVREALPALAAQGTALAVVSNKEQALAELLLERHGLRACFALVIGGDTLAAKKPDPLPLVHCLKQLRVAPSRALFVGDSALDTECARRAGVRGWAVRYGYDLAAAGPERWIDDIGEVVTALVAPRAARTRRTRV